MLVTARHIVDPEWAHCPRADPSVIYARLKLNKKEYNREKSESGTGDVPLILVDGNRPIWLKHTDEEVDVAVIPLNPSAFGLYDITEVPIWLFPTPEEQERLGIGGAVVSAV